MLSFKCPQCHVALNVADDKAGQEGKCPKCHAPLIVPGIVTGGVGSSPIAAPPSQPPLVPQSASRLEAAQTPRVPAISASAAQQQLEREEARRIIWSEIAPTSLALADVNKIMTLGENAIPVIIELFLNPRDPASGIAGNQAVLACVLAMFAKRGDERAAQFLSRVAGGSVILYDTWGREAFNIAKNFVAERPNLAAAAPGSPGLSKQPEPWEQYAKYVSFPAGASDSAVCSNGLLQFAFHSKHDSYDVVLSLPDDLKLAFTRSKHFRRLEVGVDPRTGKYLVAFHGVSVTVKEAKAIMNHMVRAGGEVYEALLS